MSDENETRIKQEAIRIIGQGTYGCILYPGFDCNGVPNENMKYLSKIQLNNENTTKENEIGQIILSIPNYQLYFAPVISSCAINISEMVDNENIRECDIVKKYKDSLIDGSSTNSNETYSMNKIFYVGNEDVKKYMNRIIVEEGDTSITYKMKLIIDLHIMILYELMQIAEKNIIHFDIKSNNIMVNSITGLPVIIDFGMSYLLESLQTPEGIDENIIRFESHDYWCFDILLMSEIKKMYRNNPQLDWKAEVMTPEKKQQIVNQFVSDRTTNKNGEYEQPVFLDLYPATEIQNEIKTGLLTYLNTNSINTWGDLYNQITSPDVMKTWDNYSVAVVFLMNIKNTGFNEKIGENALWKQYTNVLDKIMFAAPNNRQTAGQTKEELENLFTSMNTNATINNESSVTLNSMFSY
jgi:serine/threonine protein kinase